MWGAVMEENKSPNFERFVKGCHLKHFQILQVISFSGEMGESKCLCFTLEYY